jgi:hypothetical protein
MAVNQDDVKIPRGNFARQAGFPEGKKYIHLDPEEKNPGQSDFVLT